MVPTSNWCYHHLPIPARLYHCSSNQAAQQNKLANFSTIPPPESNQSGRVSVLELSHSDSFKGSPGGSIITCSQQREPLVQKNRRVRLWGCTILASGTCSGFPLLFWARTGNSALKVPLVMLPKGPTHIPQKEPALGCQLHSDHEKLEEDQNSSSGVKRFGLL